MISDFFIDRPKFAIVIAILTALVGAIGIRFIPIAQYPEIAPPQVYVTASYPGANASLIQNSVATPIEQQVNGVDGMIYMSSSSSNNGSYELTITFEIGTDPDIAAVNVQNRVALAEPVLPSAVIQQGVQTSKQSGDMLLVINLSSPDGTRDALFLSNYASDFLQDPLSRIDGVGAVNQFSDLQYSMRIWMLPNKMAALNITASELATAIENQNVEAAAGQVGAPPFGSKQTEFQFTLEAKGLLTTAEEFENIVVSANTDGSLVRLKDVARVELGAENYGASAKADNVPLAVIAVYQESGANALDVANSVYAEMEELSKKFPPGVSYELPYDVTKAVRVSIEEIVFTIGITALLVIGVTFLFLLSWRATIIPAIAIPVSLLGAMALLYLIGFSANMITLFAIVLAITLVVDDAIVIIENAERIMEEDGLDAREATQKAMAQLTRPIIATTFVLAAVFVPVSFFPGITGKIYLQFALTIVFAFALSAVNALTLGPALCAMLLNRNTGRPSGPFRIIPIAIDRVRNGYVRIVGTMLRHMAISLVICACFAAGTVYLFRTIPTGFIPAEDNGVLLSSIQLPDGASLQRTEAVMKKITDMTLKSPGVDTIVSVAGFSMIAGSRSNVGLAIFILKPWDERKTAPLQWYNILATLNEQIATLPEATGFVFPLPSIRGVGSSGGVSAQLLDYSGGDIADLEAAKTAFLTALNAAPQFSQAFSSFSANTPQYFLAVDRDRAETLGVDIGDIFTALQANLSSLYVNNFIKDSRVYWVVISADAEFRQSVEDIENIYVKNADGNSLPLRVLLSKNPTLGPETIYRYDLFRAASISGQLASDVSSGEAIAAMQSIADSTLPKDFGITWTGVTLQEVQAGGLVAYILLLAFVFAYLCLVAQYESWTLPMSVMASTIFAVFGALLPVAILPFLNNNIYTQIGIVLLIGLAAKKAIMVVEFAKVRREQGASIHHAALSAAKLRFRPVSMTGLCFIIGVLPLVLSSGAGAAGRVSIGYPVFAGMVIDSTIGLLMIPILYAAFQTMREKVRGWWHGEPVKTNAS
jgi:HAE1 family hydrophobic/amphiphilic exporter-1